MAGLVVALDTAGLEGIRKPATVGLPGVTAGAFAGEPGRGNDGLDLGLACGVGARALGPTVWLKGCLVPGPTD